MRPLTPRSAYVWAACAGNVVNVKPDTDLGTFRWPERMPASNRSSGDLRYPFMPGGPKTFGVFNLKITGGGCATAHGVAKQWMQRFEASIRSGHLKLPKSVSGFTFTTLPAHAAQTYTERGVKGGTTIRFDYRVPNG